MVCVHVHHCLLLCASNSGVIVLWGSRYLVGAVLLVWFGGLRLAAHHQCQHSSRFPQGSVYYLLPISACLAVRCFRKNRLLSLGTNRHSEVTTSCLGQNLLILTVCVLWVCSLLVYTVLMSRSIGQQGFGKGVCSSPGHILPSSMCVCVCVGLWVCMCVSVCACVMLRIHSNMDVFANST